MTRAELWPLARRTYAAWSEDKCPRLAAALALYAMLSLAPLLVITIKIVAVRLGDEAPGEVRRRATDFVGPAGAEALQEMIAHASRPGEGRLATFVSSVLLVVGATALFASIQDALNTVWGVKPRPGQGVRAMLRVRLASLLLVMAVAALLLASLVLSNVLHTLADNVGGGLVAVGYVVDLLVSLGVTTVLFALVFKFLPDVRLDWHDVWVGAAVTALLFTLGKYGLTLYFSKAAPASAFGAAGSLAALLLWVYYSGMIAFFGAEFTKAHFLSRGRRVAPRKHAVLLTPADRVIEGIPTEGQVEQAVRAEQLDGTGVPRHVPLAGPNSTHGSGGRRGAFHPASAALGAVAGCLLAWWMGRDRYR
jgi:membrane protein